MTTISAVLEDGKVYHGAISDDLAAALRAGGVIRLPKPRRPVFVRQPDVTTGPPVIASNYRLLHIGPGTGGTFYLRRVEG